MALTSLSEANIKKYSSSRLKELWDEANSSRSSFIRERQYLALIATTPARRLETIYVKAVKQMERRMRKLEAEMNLRD